MEAFPNISGSMPYLPIHLMLWVVQYISGKQKHNIDHHTYTNIDGMDHDIDIKFMRMHAEQERKAHHRFQQYYWILLYGISYIAWILYQDFEKYFSGKMGKGGKKMNLSIKEHFIFWITKLVYLGVYLFLPILMLGVVKALIGFLIAAVVCGFTLSIVFQLAHVVEGTSFPGHINGKIQNEWAVHQISSTANFSTNSKLAYFFLGGLNFQVEHHLFPGISHIHYPKINEFVKETCARNSECHIWSIRVCFGLLFLTSLT